MIPCHTKLGKDPVPSGKFQALKLTGSGREGLA